MKTSRYRLAAWAIAIALAPFVHAADIDGRWKAEFDTQIGLQKYVFDLKADGEKLTGHAIGERTEDKSDTVITEGRITKDDVSFVEPLKFQGQELRIEYKGKLKGDELKLTRQVGDVATEELIAKRVK